LFFLLFFVFFVCLLFFLFDFKLYIYEQMDVFFQTKINCALSSLRVTISSSLAIKNTNSWRRGWHVHYCAMLGSLIIIISITLMYILATLQNKRCIIILINSSWKNKIEKTWVLVLGLQNNIFKI
jgi:uncharacterized membrane protein